MMRRLLIAACALLLVPSGAWAQRTPVSPWGNAPAVIIAGSGSGGSTAPTSCTGTYTGVFVNGTTEAGFCVNGTAVETVNATTAAFTVAVTATSATLANLTSGRVAIVGTSGLVEDDAGFTYNKATDQATLVGGVLLGNLTSGRVALVGASGLVTDDSRLTYVSGTLANLPTAAGTVLANFATTTGNFGTYISDNTINASYNINGAATLYLNYYGYQLGGSQFRNTVIADGKFIELFTVNGSNKTFLTTSAGASWGLARAAWTFTAPSGPVACTSPAVSWSNGTAVFQIDVGTSCAGVSTLVVTLPSTTNAYGCRADNVSAPTTRQPAATAWSTTSVTFTNFDRTTGLAADWADGADVRITCTAG